MGKTNDLPGSKGWKLFLALGESPRPIRFFFNELENIYIMRAISFACFFLRPVSIYHSRDSPLFISLPMIIRRGDGLRNETFLSTRLNSIPPR